MTELATVNNPYFYVSRLEIDRPGRTYTIDTVSEIKRICPKDAEIFFITGADAISSIFMWKDAEKLLSMCVFIGVTRPGYNKSSLMEYIGDINEKYKDRLMFLEVPALAISSTDIRRRVALGKAFKYLLPEEVETYIKKHALYKLDLGDFDKGGAIKYLRENLTKHRFSHTMGVAWEAVGLAEQLGADKNKAYIAALLHDCAKFADKTKTLEALRELDLTADATARPGLLHGPLGAETAKKLGVGDEDILNAIRYHTTGRKNMSLLEKILFIADATEPGRLDEQSEDAVNNIRAIAAENVDRAVAAIIKRKLAHCAQKGEPVHPLGREALEYYERFN
jgi:nicotinate-nucleotide adenylyltransferase